MTKAKFGPNELTLEKTVVSVQDVFDAMQDLWDLPSGVGVRVNNAPASYSDRVPADALVEFVKVSGEKGAKGVTHVTRIQALSIVAMGTFLVAFSRRAA